MALVTWLISLPTDFRQGYPKVYYCDEAKVVNSFNSP